MREHPRGSSLVPLAPGPLATERPSSGKDTEHPSHPGPFAAGRPRHRDATALPLVLLAAACMAYEPLRAQAASDFGCSTSQIEVIEQEGLYQVMGCGRIALYHCAVGSQGQQRCAPVGKSGEQAIREIAPGELECPRDRLRVQSSGEGVFQVKGCGKQATYLCRNDQGNVVCGKR